MTETTTTKIPWTDIVEGTPAEGKPVCDLEINSNGYIEVTHHK